MRGSTVFFAVVALLPLAAAAPASEPVTLRWNAHRADVLAVAFAPAGDRIATAGQDGIVCIWDAGSGKELRRFEDCFNVWSLAFSPDGQNLAIPDRNDVQIFDVASGLPRRRFEGHVGQVWNVAFTPNGTLLATASEDGTVRLWDTATGRERRRLDEHRYGAWSLAVSGDGRRVASGASHGLVCVWETETGHLVKRFRAYHGGGVWPLSISRDGRMVATAEYGVGAVRLWETASGQERRRFATSAESLGILAASGHILTLGKEGRFAWYQPGHEPAHFRGENPRWAFRCFALSNDGRRVAGGTSDGDMHVWSVAPPREPPVPPPPAWSERECDALWSVLAADDAEPAYRAVGTLLGAPEAATNLLKPGGVPHRGRFRSRPRWSGSFATSMTIASACVKRPADGSNSSGLASFTGWKRRMAINRRPRQGAACSCCSTSWRSRR